MSFLPSGLEVEKVCVVAAAANGVRWASADQETKDSYRRAMNAALISMAGDGLTRGRTLAVELLDESVRAQRAALAIYQQPHDQHGGLDEDLLKALFRSASTTELVLAALSNGSADLAEETEF